MHQCIVSNFHTFPSFVAIHSIITAGNSRNFTGRFIKVFLQFLKKADAAFWISIPSIGKSMDINIFNIFFSTKGRNCLKVVNVRMHPSIANQPQQVQRLFIFFCVIEAIKQGLIFLKFTRFNSNIYSFKFLVNYSSCPKV